MVISDEYMMHLNSETKCLVGKKVPKLDRKKTMRNWRKESTKGIRKPAVGK